MTIILSLISFSLGLVIGSFLNVVIYRLNTGRSLGGRSACMACRSKLRFYELIPLVSYFFLLGRCRTCKAKIAIQYPLVEFITGIIFLLLFFKLRDLVTVNLSFFAITYLYYGVLLSLLIVIASYDIKHKIIPDILSFAFGALSFLGLFFFDINNFFNFYPHVPESLELLSGVLIALPFALLWSVSLGRWMGLGDAKLALGLGWFLGLPLVLSAVALGFWLGAIIGIVLILASGKYKMKSEIPFAPYLVLGALLVFFFEFNFFNFSL